MNTNLKQSQYLGTKVIKESAFKPYYENLNLRSSTNNDWLSKVQACKSTHPPGWYLKVKKAEAEAKAKEEAIRAKDKERSQKLIEEKEQNPISLVIQEEEKFLK